MILVEGQNVENQFNTGVVMDIHTGPVDEYLYHSLHHNRDTVFCEL